jgi:alkyldihydroxyacetonephosphate synthase
VDGLESLTAVLPEGAVSTHPGELAARARDWWPLALLREARGDAVERPSAVVFPRTTEDVGSVMAWAQQTGTPVVPRGGGSGVCGGAQAVRGSVVLDLSEMREVLGVDEESRVVEVQAGIRGDRLEAALGPTGLTLGHYPQSLAISSVGGWIATRSAGQASAGYGVIEDLVLGLTVVLADGDILRLRPVPRSAAGPDLRTLFVGSEGTLGIITEATLVASRLPQDLRWVAAAPATFEEGLTLVRDIAQSGHRPLVVRLYDPADAGLAFGELGHAGGPVLIVAVDGAAEAAGVGRSVHRAPGGMLDEGYGSHWWEHRFDAVDQYRRIMGPDRVFGSGVVVDTVEVAALWSRLSGLYAAIRETLHRHAEMVGCHLSHPYRSGASLYFTFLIRSADDAAAADAYLRCWRDVAGACHDGGGTITHHHGVGLLKAPFMDQEVGPAGVAVLRALKLALDPAGILNPGKLIPRGA